ncbi:fungal-specific transcription factor domain-containing protein [Plectosphaerella plurivora]|uniref:Fungal-specific transcription factor domain-containing protein n=1 Tax=Plectosphaerella plurivora TaxID=936078 RepID=A0A9P8V6L8_9PEZI|nr:fungal-specific transcription factor domain-containing protein [Plectosphaerella plurivora]
MSDKSILACKRCKVKKLKCDAEPKTCANCNKAGSVCLQVDSRSKREFRRGYVEELVERIETLKRAEQHRLEKRTSRGQFDPISPTSSNAEVTYHGVGSVINMVRIVEAAVPSPTAPPSASVAPPLTSMHVAYATTMADPGRQPVTPAALPSEDVAQSLFSSYLDGLHLLHPFLQRSMVLHELHETYARPEARNSQSLFRVNMIFALGSVSLFRGGLHHVSPMEYYAAAMQHADAAMGLNGLLHIQAILLVLIFSLQHDVGVGNKWDLARVAMRMCIESDFHRSSRNPDPMAEQMRRRVFWACYIADRHSSSVLGRPLALQDHDIQVELPVDADDDLIESRREEDQMLRGPSEVAAQLHQIGLRRITARIGTQLYRQMPSRTPRDLQAAVSAIEADLDHWREMFPVVAEPRTVYETSQWRDLNYFRERLKCYRLLVLTGGDPEDGHGNGSLASNLTRALHDADQIARLYQSLHTADKLILNWTCVHDMMSAGFSTLCCSIALRQLSATMPGTSETILAVIGILEYIAERWAPVRSHLEAFRSLARRVAESDQQGVHQNEPRAFTTTAVTNAAGFGTDEAGPDTAVDGFGGEGAFAGGANMWDAAMAAFLDAPLDLDSIEWGAIDWGAMEILAGDMTGGLPVGDLEGDGV